MAFQARGNPWSRRSLRFQAMALVCALVVLIFAAAAFIGVSINAAGGQVQAADQATALRDQAHLLGSQLLAEDNSLISYSITHDGSLLIEYRRDRERVVATRSALAAIPATSVALNERGRLLLAADSVQRWADSVSQRLDQGQTVDAGDYAQGTALQNSWDTELALFDLRAGSAAAVAHDSAAAAHQAVLVTTIVGSILGGLGLLLLAWLFLARNLRPIGRLADAAGRLSVGGTVAIPTGEGTEEVRRLSGALTVWQLLTEARLALAEDMADVSQQIDPDHVVQRAARLLGRQFSASVVGITLIDPDGEAVTHLTSEPGLGLSDVSRAPLPPGSPASVCIRTRRPVLTDLRDPTWPTVAAEYARKVGIASTIVVPMVSGGELLGAVALVRRTSVPDFTEDDVSRAGVIVPQVAAALNVARLIKRLDHANRHKSEFVAHMSHELRTPLNSILGFAQLLGSGDYGPLNERQQRYIGHVHASGVHLLSLITDVLDLSNLESGQLEVVAQTVAVKPLLASCIDELGALAARKSLQLSLRARGALSVRADGRRLRQVVLNLVSNAIKFTPEGGVITLEAERDGSEVCIRVRDTGLGVPAGDRERIFEAFTQVRNGRTRSEEGTGLGLALSRKLMELMGGSLVLDARHGRGATFTVRLPAAVGAAAIAAV